MQQLGRIYQTLRQKGGAMLITADHGNAEMMVDPVTGGPHTAHTTNPVPFVLVSEDAQQILAEARRIAARPLANHPQHARPRSAEADDWRGSAGNQGLVIGA